MKLEEKLLEQYFDVIEKNGNTENQIQEFLEENTIFIPMPFLLNHYLHMNCVISKFKLGNEFVTDFAYLTKSSDYWEFVLVELEVLVLPGLALQYSEVPLLSFLHPDLPVLL